MNKVHPKTFHIPSLQVKRAVDKSDIVKVGIMVPGGAERFWIIVTGRNGSEIRGRVDNKPLIAPVRFRQTLAFHERHILDVDSDSASDSVKAVAARSSIRSLAKRSAKSAKRSTPRKRG